MGFEAARSCIQIVALKRPSARFGCLVDLAQIEEMKFKFYANTEHTHTHIYPASCADNVLSIAFGHFLGYFLFCALQFAALNFLHFGDKTPKTHQKPKSCLRFSKYPLLISQDAY